MPTAAQTATASSFKQLVWRLADQFPDCDSIREQDLPTLTDDDLSVTLNYEPGMAFDAARPSAWADILNSAVYTSQERRDAALANCLRDALTFEIRSFVCSEVNVELAYREQRFGHVSPEQSAAQSACAV